MFRNNLETKFVCYGIIALDYQIRGAHTHTHKHIRERKRERETKRELVCFDGASTSA